jgi:hypothetical protein
MTRLRVLTLGLVVALLSVLLLGCSPQAEAPSANSDALTPGSNPTESQKAAMRAAHMPQGKR